MNSLHVQTSAVGLLHFYCVMLRRARYCHGQYGSPSLRPSVTLRYRDHVGWNSLKIISRLVRLRCSLFADPSIIDLRPRGNWEHPKILAGIGVEYGKWLSAYKSSNMSETRQDRTNVTIEV